jgi:hypothetical protein
MNGNSPNGGPVEDVAANGGLLGIKNSQEYTRYGRAGWTSAPSPKTVNELRAGLFEDRLFDPASQSVPGVGNAGVTIAGVTVGAVNPNSSLLNERRYQLVDNFTLTANTHTLKVGGDLWRTRDRIDALNSAGAYAYPSLTAFAQDFSGGSTRSYTSFTEQFGDPVRELPVKQVNLYAQDTWRPTQHLTLTAGVRWEKAFPPQPTQASTSFFQTWTIASPDIDFAPRFGAAYMPDEKTVIRLGFGFYYAPFPGRMLDALFLGNGINQTSISVNPNQAGAPLFPNAMASAASIPTGTKDLISGVAKLRNPRNQETTLAVERSLGHETTLTVSVMNGRAIKLWTGEDTNLVESAKTVTYPIDNAEGKAVGSYSTPVWSGKGDTSSAYVYQVDNIGASWYDAAIVEVRKRMSHGIAVEGSYTWSHAIGDTGGPLVDGFLPLSTQPGNFATDKGSTATDQRHRAAIRWLWQPTVTRSTSPAARFLVNGWELSSITTLASGEPETAVAVVRGQQFSTVPMAYTDSLNGSGGWARVPFLPVSDLYAAPQYDVDLRVTRTLPFTERVKGMLVFEAFNVFNRQRATALNTVAFQAVAAPPPGTVSGPMNGALKPVAGLGTGIASNGFPDGTSARRCQVAFRVVF